MADGANFQHVIAPAPPPPLAWRRPFWLWALATLAIGAGWPLLFLSRDGGLAHLAAISVGAALLAAFAALAIAYRIGRPPRLRRHVVIYVLAATAFVALIAPFAYAGLLGVQTGLEGSQQPASYVEIAGLKSDMAWAVAPLALVVGAPAALVAGLAFSALGFRKQSAASSDVLIARRAPQISEDA